MKSFSLAMCALVAVCATAKPLRYPVYEAYCYSV